MSVFDIAALYDTVNGFFSLMVEKLHFESVDNLRTSEVYEKCFIPRVILRKRRHYFIVDVISIKDNRKSYFKRNKKDAYFFLFKSRYLQLLF